MPLSSVLAFVRANWKAIGVGLLFVTTGAAGHYRSRLVETVSALSAARKTAQLALAASARDSARAAAFERRGDSLQASAESANRRADSAVRVATAARAQFATAVKAAADTCAGVVKTASQGFAADDGVAAALRQSRDSASAAAQEYRTALDSTAGALTLLRKAATHLDTAASRAVSTVRPSFLARLAPHRSVGLTAGIDRLGHPALVLGISYGWPF